MKHGLFCVIALLAGFSGNSFAWAQSAVTQSPRLNVVPNLIKFSGTARDTRGEALNGVLGVTFALYHEEQGGAALWRETQNLTADRSGHYSAALGLTSAEGIPTELFTSGEAQWLSVQIAGQPEDRRILLLSVPYALKAKDSETLGGLPASAFALAGKQNAGTVIATPEVGTAITPNATPTGGGSTGSVALWTSASNLGSSNIVQTGTGSTAKVGVNTLAPVTTLDVAGATTLRGAVGLTPIAAATSAIGAYSQQLNLTASAFNSSTVAAVNQTFQWKAEPTANNTTSPAATLNLLFGAGTATPAETGLKIAKNGTITFVPGQTYPGAGTITGVTAGTALTGGGTSGTISLNLDTTKVPLLAAHNTFTQPITFAPGQTYPGAGTITGVTAGTGLTGGGTAGNITVGLNTAFSDARYAGLNVVNTFTQSQHVRAGAGGLDVQSTGNALSGTGNIGVTGRGNVGVYGVSSFSGGSSDGVLGHSTNATAVRGDDTGSGSGLVGTSASGFGVYGTSATGTAVYGVGGAFSAISINPSAVVGDSSSANGVTGISATSTGVVAVNRKGNYGLLAASQGSGMGLYATAATVDKDYGVGIRGESFGTQVSNLGGPDGVQGITHSNLGSGVAGINEASGGIGVYGIATNGGFGMATPGHVQQGRTGGGWVKAMAYVDPFAPGGIAITRCYNSQATGAAVYTAPCGFAVTHNGQGVNTIDFGFAISDRFVQVAPNLSYGVIGNLADFQPTLTFATTNSTTVFPLTSSQALFYTAYAFGSNGGNQTDDQFVVTVY